MTARKLTVYSDKKTTLKFVGEIKTTIDNDSSEPLRAIARDT